MVMFRKNRVSMRRYCCIFVYCLAAFAFLSCVKDPVRAYDEGDSAVYFLSPTNVFSLIGKSGDEIELICEGEDEEEALKKMVEAIEAGLGE